MINFLILCLSFLLIPFMFFVSLLFKIVGERKADRPMIIRATNSPEWLREIVCSDPENWSCGEADGWRVMIRRNIR